MGSVSRFICQKLVSLFLVFLHFLQLFSLISTYFSGLRRKDSEDSSLEKNLRETISIPHEAEESVSEFRRGVEDFVGEEKPEFLLTFKFPTFEEFSRSNEETGKLFLSEAIPSGSNNSQDSISSTNGFGGFIDEPGAFCIKEDDTFRNGDSPESAETVSDEVLLDKNLEKVQVPDEVKEDSINNVLDEEESEKIETIKEKPAKAEEKLQDFMDEFQYQSEENSVFTDSSFDSESESTSFDHVLSVVSSVIDGFLSDGDFASENQKNVLVDNEETDIMEGLRKMEEDNFQDPRASNLEFLSEDDFSEELDKTKNGDSDDKGMNNNEDSSENLESKDSSSNKLEQLWEHQELIDQLKMELRKVKATGLPTILEESESPKMEDLKPWKIDEKLLPEDCSDELHKFYKCYRVRMRKFDILNYQKMYTTGFLQLKDPLESVPKEKHSGPSLKSLLRTNLRFSKQESHDRDPMNKFIKELQSDLEIVYVGQMCLSWEFLRWQYDKALELWESDPHGIRRYNEVAGEFQQFQVILERFIEDEPFQGPRIRNYIKNRCLLRNLLQVPLIREDISKDKSKARKKHKEENVVTSDMLVETVGESIRIFWQFVQADKDCTSEAIKRTPDLQKPEDLQLFVEIRKTLQKKERSLKDMVRSERCILKKFRQNQEDDSSQVLYYFALIDMKLVCRVMNMSKLTSDQLMWCQEKVNIISFVNRKMYIKPSFLLFPC